jgi:16S rRNA C967 or C1407 C5-methylase (RsmB/RsmF family)
VPWLPLPAEVAFLELSPAYSVASCPLYIAGHVYGMDVASGAAIFALDPQPGEHILDLCCCPGAKLCLIGDLMKGRGSLTGQGHMSVHTPT